VTPNLYAIGDIHGSLDSLERLMDKINLDLTRDGLVFVGDYIDRGPRSKGVVDYIIRLKNQAPPGQIICLKGNHEAMFLDYLAGGPGEMFLYNGGLATLENYWGDDWLDQGRDSLTLPPDHARFYQDLELYYDIPVG
jgi:serine/threonine protein phosphatase 1